MTGRWWEKHDTGFIAIGLFAGGLYGKFFLQGLEKHLLALLAGLLLGLLLAHYSKERDWRGIFE